MNTTWFNYVTIGLLQLNFHARHQRGTSVMVPIAWAIAIVMIILVYIFVIMYGGGAHYGHLYVIIVMTY